ncbi:DUF1003 domain-containing protein [Arenibacter sp. TNZ]|jgi:uncharacterized membrane protein|uniref:DUF1003 domain-containing protein n=1 Tax=Arenibacter TaxID=178469 RepID=UPI000CD3FD22|nr:MULTISPECIES: DUF1003 domain-containing protein [Arenibacter]MCM4173333.1 DUF1003 domain-containing protein [Arenibacter sp. TNZ]
MKTFVSAISLKEYPVSEQIPVKTIRKSIMDLIHKEHPEINSKKSISVSELNLYRQKYLSEYLIQEVGELSTLEEDVLKTIQQEKIITTQNESLDEATEYSFGQRLADKVATFGGSWRFIIIFGIFIFIWMVINIIFLMDKGFDPYPFILLNLILSCLAALQAPVIMMSQNRQEEKDRERSKQDYMVNLKAELEIRILHEKLDHLIIHQQQELLNIQQIQVEMMEDIMNQIKKQKS